MGHVPEWGLGDWKHGRQDLRTSLIFVKNESKGKQKCPSYITGEGDVWIKLKGRGTGQGKVLLVCGRIPFWNSARLSQQPCVGGLKHREWAFAEASRADSIDPVPISRRCQQAPWSSPWWQRQWSDYVHSCDRTGQGRVDLPKFEVMEISIR